LAAADATILLQASEAIGRWSQLDRKFRSTIVVVREDKEKNDELAIRTEAESQPGNAYSAGFLRPG
jgi:hypothetical protein